MQEHNKRHIKIEQSTDEVRKKNAMGIKTTQLLLHPYIPKLFSQGVQILTNSL